MNIYTDYEILSTTKSGKAYHVKNKMNGETSFIPLTAVDCMGDIKGWVFMQKKNKKQVEYEPIIPKKFTEKGVMEEAEIEITIVQKIKVKRKVNVWYPKARVKENKVEKWLVDAKKEELAENYKKIATENGKIYDDIIVEFLNKC